MRIAVIDSEIAVAQSFVDLLKAAGAELQAAVAEESLTKLLATPESAEGFDVVLLDSCFGGLVAVESHVRLCRRKGWPVMVHSHEPGSSVAGRGLRAGAVATISKYADTSLIKGYLARAAAGRVVIDTWWARALLASGPVRGEQMDVALLRGIAAGVPLTSLAQWHGRCLSECEAGIFRVAERNCGPAGGLQVPQQLGPGEEAARPDGNEADAQTAVSWGSGSYDETPGVEPRESSS